MKTYKKNATGMKFQLFTISYPIIVNGNWISFFFGTSKAYEMYTQLRIYR